MNDETKKATPEERLVHIARQWRGHDKAYIAEKSDDLRKVEYAARKDLRKAIDEVGEPSTLYKANNLASES